MRTTRMLAGALLTGAALFATAGPAMAEDPTASPSAGEGEAGPTEAGTTFRTATEIRQDQQATARASTGDYLYWVFPADAGQRATVKATVMLPESAARHGAATWQIDVYDGLRRRQACMYGRQTKAVPADAASVELSCTLRTVRAWAEPWSGDPLPGSYYVRLTVLDLPDQDLGLPVEAAVEATSADTGGAYAVDGALSVPLVPGAVSERDQDGEENAGENAEENAGENAGEESSEQVLSAREPEDGWSSGWWSDRWIWTAVGGVLAALAGVGGYSLTRGSGRPSHVPPGA